MQEPQQVFSGTTDLLVEEKELAMNRKKLIWLAGMVVGLASAVMLAQQAQKPLTNDDVIKMVKGGLPESVVVAAIQSSPAKYDTSPDGLIKLQKAGVTPNELNAVMAASAKGSAAGPSSGSDGTSTANAGTASPGSSTTSSKWKMPKVTLTQGGSSQELPLEKTQLAETKTKPSSMGSLAADSAVTQAMQAGISTAAWDTAVHMNSGVGGAAVGEAGGIFAGMMGRRKPTVTYVWGVPGPSSKNVLSTSSPTFSVDFSRAPGVNPDDYEPAIVKLTPAQNSCRIIGATQGKEDARSSSAADWQIYSHFLEERVATKSQKLGQGNYTISPASELLPGEYGLVLRPTSKTKSFSGGDVARGQGDGMIFDTVWSFQVSAGTVGQ